MGERWRMAYIALTAVVVALAIASAILSAARPKSPQSEALYTPGATPSPSPSATFTPQPPTSTPVATSTPSPSPTSTPVPTRTPRPSPTFTSYVVRTGDTLGAIARTFGVTVQAILAANPDITDPTYVKAGQTILIPPPGWAPSPSSRSS
jgi:LysM repeat protein